MRDEANSTFGNLMAIILLLVAGILIFFYHIGRTDIVDPRAAQIAVQARHIQKTGFWLNPGIQDQFRMMTPPFYTWLVSLSTKSKTGITAGHVRIPGATAAILIMLIAALLIHRHINRYQRDDEATTPTEGFPLLAGLILGSSPLLFIAGRSGTPDALYTLFYFASVFCVTESLEARRSFYASHSPRTWLILGYGFVGLAMLTNGPLAFYLLWIPYLLTARSYRLKRFDWIHFPGILISLLIGTTWLLGRTDTGNMVFNWIQFWISGDSMNSDETNGRLTVLFGIFVSTFPWLPLTAVMIYRIQSKKDRSPALVYWSWSLLANGLLLFLLAPEIGDQSVMLIPFVTLLAVAGLYRWNFEVQPWSTIWHQSMRVVLAIFILAGFFIALLLHSAPGLSLFILAASSWLFWIVRTYGHRVMHTPWTSAIRVCSIAVILIITAEVMILSDWEPRRRYHLDTLAFFDRIAIRSNEKTVSHLFYQPGSRLERSRFLHDYHLDSLTKTLRPGMDIQPLEGIDQFIYLQGKDDMIKPDANWIPIAYDYDGLGEIRETVFRVNSSGDITRDEPTRIAILGNTGTRRNAQKDVAKRLGKWSDHSPLDHAILLGNNIYGPSFSDHLDFSGSFLRPFRDLLRDGVMFHAVLGHEDQSYAWLHSHYRPFHMYGRRYYRTSLDNGRTELFVLDTERRNPIKEMDPEQLSWLKSNLDKSKATWKIVGLHRSLVSRADEDLADRVLAAQLLPVFEKHGVNLVCWAGGEFYERIEDRESKILYLNCGWSGNKGSKYMGEFRPGSGFYSRDPGFVWVEATNNQLTWKAVTDRKRIVDQGIIWPYQ